MVNTGISQISAKFGSDSNKNAALPCLAATLLTGEPVVLRNLPDIEDVIKAPDKAKCPQALDAGYAAVQLCLHYAKPENVDPIWQYVERLAKELQVSAAVSLCLQSGGTLINSKALGSWVAKNRALINNVMT